MLEPESQPPLTHIPISFSTRNTPQDLQTAVNKLLSKGAIEPVFHPETKGFSSCLFPGAKEHRGSMSCHRSLPPEWPSGHLQFKMETQASVRSSIRERECTMSINIQDAYLRIPMARPIQKYFQFIVIGWVYQFSLAASLWESTKAVRCHNQGSPQTFGHVDLYGHPSAKRSVLLLPNPMMGIRGLVSGDRVLVRQHFSGSDHSPSGGWVGLLQCCMGSHRVPYRQRSLSLQMHPGTDGGTAGLP